MNISVTDKRSAGKSVRLRSKVTAGAKQMACVASPLTVRASSVHRRLPMADTRSGKGNRSQKLRCRQWHRSVSGELGLDGAIQTQSERSWDIRIKIFFFFANEIACHRPCCRCDPRRNFVFIRWPPPDQNGPNRGRRGMCSARSTRTGGMRGGGQRGGGGTVKFFVPLENPLCSGRPATIRPTFTSAYVCSRQTIAAAAVVPAK